MVSTSFFSVKEFAVRILRPFLRFVILEPNMSSQFAQLRMSLPKTLLRSSRDKITRLSVISFLEDSVSCVQVTLKYSHKYLNPRSPDENGPFQSM